MITGSKDDPDHALEPISGSRALVAGVTRIVVAAAVYLTVTVL